MSEVHTTITSDKSGNQIVVHNPGVVPSNPLSGTAVTTVKTSGGTSVQGTVPNTGVIISNPA